MNPVCEKHIRRTALPTLFCPGCGSGTILNVMMRLVDKMGVENFVFTSGSGCNGWIPVMINADVQHTLHGRPVAVATGIKLALPEKHVVVFTGDGDCVGIGGNHFIHAARRNIDITVVMINNLNYGMTGGQLSPTTPYQGITKTSPAGNLEQPFDAVNLAIGAGASFVARETTTAPRRLMATLEKAILHKGFAFIDVITQCPTQAGKNLYGSSSPEEVFRMIKQRAVSRKDQPLQEGQFHTGILHLTSETPVFAPYRG